MTTHTRFRDRLAATGISVTVEQGRLVINGPKRALTPELVAEIRRLKSGLVFAIEEEGLAQLSEGGGSLEPSRLALNTVKEAHSRPRIELRCPA